MALEWIDSPLLSLPGVNPLTGGITEHMIIAVVGYFGEPDGSFPSSGVPYFCRVVVALDNPNLQGNTNVQTGVFLPSNTSFVTPPVVRCLRNRAGSNEPASDVTQELASDCRVSPMALPNGASNLGERPIASRNVFEFQFQLVTTGPIQGALTGYVNSFFGELFPEVEIGVGTEGTFPISPPSPPSQGRTADWKVAFVAMSPQGFPSYPVQPPQEPWDFYPRPPGPRSLGKLEQGYRVLIQAADFATHPAWSPDGTEIAYGDLDASSGRFQIFIARTNRSGTRRLTAVSPLNNMSCLFPQWSADGSRIMMQATRGLAAAPGSDDSFWQIYTMRADGTDPQAFTQGPSNKTFPVFSRSTRPGIEAIVFLNNGVVMSVDSDEKNLRSISRDAGTQRRFLAASRKHRWIAFNETPPGSSASDLIVMHTATKVSRRINGGVSPTFTSDGNWIASNVPWLVSIDGTNLFVSLWQYGDDQLDWL